jgi:hypothetical protein
MCKHMAREAAMMLNNIEKRQPCADVEASGIISGPRSTVFA